MAYTKEEFIKFEMEDDHTVAYDIDPGRAINDRETEEDYRGLICTIEKRTTGYVIVDTEEKPIGGSWHSSLSEAKRAVVDHFSI